jgi:hypothetical protein
MVEESRRSILSAIDSRNKVLALVTLVIEASFLGSIAALPTDRVFGALVVCAAIFAIVVVGVLVLEWQEIRSKPDHERAKKDSIPALRPKIRVIKNPDDFYYLVDGNICSHIPDAETFNYLGGYFGFSWGDAILMLPDEIKRQFVLGTQLPTIRSFCSKAKTNSVTDTFREALQVDFRPEYRCERAAGGGGIQVDRIKVHSPVIQARNVTVSIENIVPSPRDQVFKFNVHLPYELGTVDINPGTEKYFVVTESWQGGEGLTMSLGSDTESHRRIRMFPDEVWNMRIKVSSANADSKELNLVLYMEHDKLIVSSGPPKQRTT